MNRFPKKSLKCELDKLLKLSSILCLVSCNVRGNRAESTKPVPGRDKNLNGF